MPYPRLYNAATDMIERHLTEGRGDKIAFIDAKHSLTYRQLLDETGRAANLLTALGLSREHRVALLLHDTTAFPIAFWGAVRAGIIPVALNTLLTSEQYKFILEDSRARAIIVTEALLTVIQPILGDLPMLTHVIVAGATAPPFGFSFAHELAQQPAEFRTVETTADEVAFWLYSSGSTGMPKGVRHVHTAMMETARHYGQGVLGITSDDVVFSAAKLFFAYGLGNGMSFPLSVGATTVLLPERPTPESVFRTLRTHRPTIFFGVPTLYTAMLAYPEGARDAGFERLRLCASAGEALPAEIGRAWKSKFGVDIIDGVGSTEMLHIYVSNRPGDIAYGSSGKPVAGYQVRLLDEQDREVGDGEVGEMLVKGSSAADGYWNQRQKSRTTFVGEWMRTGDKYTRDAAGNYTYAGRTDDMFKVSGIWVSPFEVESALISHAAVLEAAVVPAEDGDGLIKPKAVVVLKAGQTAGPELITALQDHVKSKAGPWKYPRWVVVVESLPKTATGKIQRFKLRNLA